MMERFLWTIFPYMAVVIAMTVLIWRYRYQQLGWSSKSSQFLEKKQLFLAGPGFHLGIFAVLGGHVGGVLVPKAVTEMSGVTEEMYHMGAVFVGIPAGVLLTVCFVCLLWRRLSNRRIWLANTSVSDRWLLLFLFFSILTGMAATLSNAGHSAFNYRDTVSPWFRSLLLLQPEPELMAEVPFLFKLHMISWMLLVLALPFTRLVHFLSFPFGWFFRAPLIYRRRMDK